MSEVQYEDEYIDHLCFTQKSNLVLSNPIKNRLPNNKDKKVN